MRTQTMDKYKSTIDALYHKLGQKTFNKHTFDKYLENFKISRAMLNYLKDVDVISHKGRGEYKFARQITYADLQKISEIQKNQELKRMQKPTQMTIETSVPKVDVINTDSDEFAAQAMAYLESRGFKVTKEKHNLPVVIYRSTIISALSPLQNHMIQQVGKMEIEHIRMAYRAGESGTYKSPEQYLKDEYNDFTA